MSPFYLLSLFSWEHTPYHEINSVGFPFKLSPYLHRPIVDALDHNAFSSRLLRNPLFIAASTLLCPTFSLTLVVCLKE